MAFDINKVPIPGTAEADVSALHSKLSRWLATGGADTPDGHPARIHYVVEKLAEIQAQMFRERQKPLEAAVLAAPAHGPPDDECTCSRDERVYCHAIGCRGGANLPSDAEIRIAEIGAAIPVPAPELYGCIGNCGTPVANAGEHCGGCETHTTWSTVLTGDEVYSEVDGRWWEVSEADAGQVTIANADAGRTITFTPEAGAPIRVRRGAIGAAADALRAGGLNAGAA